MEVDVELVLAVDISYSMDIEEQRLQREGYIKALTSPRCFRRSGTGRTAGSPSPTSNGPAQQHQRIVVPWQVIDGPETADAFAAKLAAQPISRWYRTSISGAILFGQELFEGNGYQAPRRVLDISGDGPNNHGALVEDARDRALKAGIVINGLPIMINNGRRSVFDMDDLDDYYTDCVIGGPGAFMIAITQRDQFVAATRQKILREIADNRGFERASSPPTRATTTSLRGGRSIAGSGSGSGRSGTGTEPGHTAFRLSRKSRIRPSARSMFSRLLA